MLDHVLYSALHRNRKEDKEVQHKNGPKDRDVKSAEKGHKEGSHSASCARQPELELGKSSCKWPIEGKKKRYEFQLKVRILLHTEKHLNSSALAVGRPISPPSEPSSGSNCTVHNT